MRHRELARCAPSSTRLCWAYYEEPLMRNTVGYFRTGGKDPLARFVHAGDTPRSARQLTHVGEELERRSMRLTNLHHGDHADEFGDRRGLHLLHDTGTVGLDGLFACAQGIGDFLIQQPGSHQAHDIPLPWRQRGDALAQRGVLALAVPSTVVLLKRCRDGCQQVLVIYRFLEEIDGPPLHSPSTHGNRPMAGEEDDGRAPRSGPQSFLYYQNVLARNPHIQH